MAVRIDTKGLKCGWANDVMAGNKTSGLGVVGMPTSLKDAGLPSSKSVLGKL